MRQRLFFLLKLTILFLVFFALQKPLFMHYNSEDNPFSFGDVVSVIWHGLKLDSSVVGYLLVIPWLVTLLSFWFQKIPIKKILFVYYAAIAIVMAVIFVLDTCLYEYWGFKLDATIFTYIDSPSNAVASVSIWYVILRIFLIIVLTLVYFALLNAITPQCFRKVKSDSENSTFVVLLYTFFWLALFAPLFITIRGGISESTSNVGRVYFSENQFFNHSAVNPVFSFLSSLGKHEDFAAQFNFFEEDARAALFDGLYPTIDYQLTDTLINNQRPNVLLIILESCGASVVESCGGMKGVMPRFDKIIKDGVFFSNFYSNSFRTDRGLVSTLSGYLGQPTTSIMKMAEKCDKLPGIAKTLRENGYSTHFLYGGDIDFTNMKGYLISIGYSNIISDKDFSIVERNSNSWGAQDEYTCQRLLKEVKQLQYPWHFAYLTLSSHEPFEVPENKLENKVANAFAYTDNCIGNLIDSLKVLPLWDSTLVVILPDHNIRNSELPNHRDVDDAEFYRAPMVWTGGAIKQGGIEIKKIVNQTDLPATLLGQMNIDHEDFIFSRNVLDSNYVYPFAFSSYNNGIVFRDSTGVTVIDNNSNTAIHGANSNRERRAKAILQTLFDDMALR